MTVETKIPTPIVTDREKRMAELRKARAARTPEEKTATVDLALGDAQCFVSIGNVERAHFCSMSEGHADALGDRTRVNPCELRHRTHEGQLFTVPG